MVWVNSNFFLHFRDLFSWKTLGKYSLKPLWTNFGHNSTLIYPISSSFFILCLCSWSCLGDVKLFLCSHLRMAKSQINESQIPQPSPSFPRVSNIFGFNKINFLKSTLCPYFFKNHVETTSQKAILINRTNRLTL